MPRLQCTGKVSQNRCRCPCRCECRRISRSCWWLPRKFPARTRAARYLSGTYDVKTLTPLERPEEYGTKLTLSDDEAEGLARRAAEARARRNAASDPARGAPPRGGDGSTGSAGNVGGYNSFWLDRGTGAFKIDGKWRTSIITFPEDGRRPALTQEAQRRADARARRDRPNTGTAWWLEQGLDPGPYDDPDSGRSRSAACWDSARPAVRPCCPSPATTSSGSCRRRTTS